MLKESNLHNYQLKAIEHVMCNPFSGLVLDMGLGKTVSTLTALNKLMFEEFDISRPLVVAPKRVTESVWTDEVEEWEHLKHLKLSVIAGTARQRDAALYKKADIYLISRDNIVWLLDKFAGKKLPFDALVIDESSSFKNPRSKRFKAIRKTLPSFKRVVILTGTPTPNGYGDLWSQIYLLDRGLRLGRTLTSYREKFFNPGQRNGHIVYNYVPKKGAVKEINDKISDICISMKSEDYLKLPEAVYKHVRIEFPPELKKKYEEFEEEQVLEMFGNGEEITAVNSAVLGNKLCQFCNGAIYDEDKNTHLIHDLKLDALEEFVESANGKPVLVAREYQHDSDRILKRLAKYGAKELKSPQDIKDWNAGKIAVLVMHPASGGHGLNLQKGGNLVVWFGQIWNLEYYLQLNKRLHRQGQLMSVLLLHLMIAGSIEEDILKARNSKAKDQNGLYDAIKARMDKYLKLHGKDK